MNISDIDRLTTKYPLGEIVAQGKTKKIYRIENDEGLVALISQDDITAGDGAKHDTFADKGRFSNETTCNVFRLLKACGVPVAFVEQDSPNSFIAPWCQMLPFEVVVRREGHGSYLKRNPHLSKGQLFPKLLVEFFLKTSGKVFEGTPLVCDDPLMMHMKGTSTVALFNPAQPIHGQKPFAVLHAGELFSSFDEFTVFPEMERIARETFLVLEKAWQIEGRTLVDFKVEFGFDTKGNLLLADVIDNDSWRVLENGAYIDKQVYRDGGKLDDVAEKYAHVAEITSHFRLPLQQIILWRGSEKDDVSVFEKGSVGDGPASLVLLNIVCSVHKEPVRAALELNELIQNVPDSVVIAYVGRSNGAGPMLSAASTVPVITVPASVKEFPEDVWSSLRSPSNVPVMTVLEPTNAILAALQILSARNPLIYAQLRSKVEERAVNVIEI